MKTILKFEESMSKERLIIQHDIDVEVLQETRKDHIEWTDIDGNPLINRDYIVVRFASDKQVDWSAYRRRQIDAWQIGYCKIEKGNMTELLFYDRVTFTWVARDLEAMGLFRVTHRVIPQWSEGELFPCYFNAKGFYQWAYNIIAGSIQLPFVLYSEAQEKKNGRK